MSDDGMIEKIARATLNALVEHRHLDAVYVMPLAAKAALAAIDLPAIEAAAERRGMERAAAFVDALADDCTNFITEHHIRATAKAIRAAATPA